ncbi:hypothetical protein [uncultured Streptococcus sp.]|uniref:hypothetical protein n=1 Tax=uncultured Streptococcus sp. TaxID=83427 RepID=UPI003211A896
MNTIKQSMIEALKHSIAQAEARIEKSSDPCVKSLAHSHSAERDFWRKKLKRYKKQLEELEE